MGTFLSFDHGKKKIGIGIGDDITRSARALTTVRPDWPVIEKIIRDWAPGAFVVGLPLDKNGGEQPASRAARAFARALETRYGKPVHLCDERYSSLAAQSNLRTHRQDADADDAEAARLILEQFFNETRA